MNDLEYLANRCFGKPKPKSSSLEETVAWIVGLSAAAFFASLSYNNGIEDGRREVLREVGPISNQPALMKEYLQEQGVYMFDRSEFGSAHR
jgi:hypothetical protein